MYFQISYWLDGAFLKLVEHVHLQLSFYYNILGKYQYNFLHIQK